VDLQVDVDVSELHAVSIFRNLYNNMIIIIAVRASNLINIIDNKQ